MDREKIAFTLLKPLDMELGLMISAFRRLPNYKKIQDGAYQGLRTVLRSNFEKQNALKVEGEENVPTAGGLVVACNHQSWSDVQVLGSSCPRRLYFMAKSEFRTWPILRHLIAITDSPFINRTGDKKGLAEVVNFLQSGKAICIFPEATIPGEEDIRRSAVEPHTGLLRGRSGMIRIALEAKVPILPVGVSGTSASFPPEVYPRLELLRLPRPTPISVRFGKPITLDEYYDKDLGYEDIRTLTDKVMKSISGLVEHKRNYIPIQVPVKPLPRLEKVGVLLLHGFTSSTKTVDGLVPYLEKRNIPYAMPVLRGHGTHYRDMAGTTAKDWYDDAEKALLELKEKVDKVIVVGLSMGGLVAIDLGIRHPDKIASVVTMAAALRFKDPLAGFSKYMSRAVKFWPSPKAYHDADCEKRNMNYPKFATDAFVSLYDYSREIEARLPRLMAPIMILQSKKDQVVAPVSANLIYEGVSSDFRDIIWFDRSGHEMGQDMEAKQVFETIDSFIGGFIKEAPVVEPVEVEVKEAPKAEAKAEPKVEAKVKAPVETAPPATVDEKEAPKAEAKAPAKPRKKAAKAPKKKAPAPKVKAKAKAPAKPKKKAAKAKAKPAVEKAE